MASYTDQAGVSFQSYGAVKRIVSLAPSITELLFDLGMEKELVGVTYQCKFPAVKTKLKAKVGDYWQPNIDAIRDLQPAIVFVNQFLIPRETIEKLRSEFVVWESGVSSLEGALDQIRKIGELTQKENIANWLTEKVSTRFSEAIQNIGVDKTGKSVVFITGFPNAWRAAGSNTLPDYMIGLLGYENALSSIDSYISLKSVTTAPKQPDFVFMPESLMAYQPQFIHEIKSVFPDAQIRYVQNEIMEWQGSRLLRSPKYLVELKMSLK